MMIQICELCLMKERLAAPFARAVLTTSAAAAASAPTSPWRKAWCAGFF